MAVSQGMLSENSINQARVIDDRPSNSLDGAAANAEILHHRITESQTVKRLTDGSLRQTLTA
jgi:hypothetical protein